MMNLDLLPLPAMMGNGDWIHPVALGTGIIRTDGGRDGFQTTFNEQQETATPESRKASKGAPPPNVAQPVPGEGPRLQPRPAGTWGTVRGAEGLTSQRGRSSPDATNSQAQSSRKFRGRENTQLIL